MTENERQQAMRLDNYWIYRVFEPFSERPDIYRIVNPFKTDDIQLEPLKYRATVKIKAKK